MTVDWGALILERAHIDWMPLDQFNLRVGYFLTPYGIFNVDHSSATRIMLIATAAMAHGIIPERQNGIEIFGLFYIGAWQLGYHAYVSNGRTTSVDFTDDKAVGGRLYFQLRDVVRLQIGASFFYGNYQDVEKSIGINNGVLGIVRTTTVEFSELAGGVDVSLDVDALRIRVEGIANQTIYTEGKHPIYFGTPRANMTMMAVYSIVAYQLPWLGMEPALWGEWSYIPTPGVADEFVSVGVGLNFYITPSVIIRTHFLYGTDLDDAENTTQHLAGARLVITY
jgi:hypothetical protein